MSLFGRALLIRRQVHQVAAGHAQGRRLRPRGPPRGRSAPPFAPRGTRRLIDCYFLILLRHKRPMIIFHAREKYKACEKFTRINHKMAAINFFWKVLVECNRFDIYL